MSSPIPIPFNEDNFNEEMKPKISGVDLVLEFANIESSVSKVAVDCMSILGESLYEKLCSRSASADPVLQDKGLDLLQRAMLHFCIYEHLIFLVTRIKNDGVTVAKNDNETTVYKYQQNNLEVKLVSLGWFWMNQLIKLLNANADQFPDWKDSDQQKELSDIPIGLSDFDKWVGVKDEYFIIVARWLIREVWMDCVLSRSATPEKTDSITRAVCYEVMGRACKRLSYYMLPEPIRKDVSDEMGKNHASQEDQTIRDKVSRQFFEKASAYWIGMDLDLKQKAIDANTRRAGDPPTFKALDINQSDSFCY